MTALPSVEFIVRSHRILIDRFGGSHGIRGDGMQLLESAIGALNQRLAYSDAITAPELAAMACLRIAQAHPFVDGNKRVAAFAFEAILGYSGMRIAEGRSPAFAHLLVSVLSHEITEEQFISQAVRFAVLRDPRRE